MEKYLTVTALTKYIKRKLDIDPHLRSVWLKGEISNFKHHSRGHMYMTIKDDHARIQAVMFAGNNRYLKFIPENGMHVLIHGDISVFEASGQYQIYIQRMEPDGFGSLYLAFEQLKTSLSQRGFFSNDHKQEIPAFPNRIGVVTSPTGAAVRDIITTIKRRYPVAAITVVPALVQGVHAGNDIARAIRFANQLNQFDVLIVGRGGGSIEELWGFNEQVVAEAIYESRIPIISAVGHETDVTISDYVADLRAPTPTGAAELAVPSIYEVLGTLGAMKRSMQQSMDNLLTSENRHLKRLMRSYAFRYPEQLLRQKEQEMDKLSERFKKKHTNHSR
ncbi:exodeoxyribonuclease VII large subunit [Virgibacillus halophilus]|uniref:Exodeoxyribonuclease 7 large subunit n=1 Tax=Tigheibacillus halophilus TaxID=361280 RepID=A0ABU5CAZ1_9BACI|nr:exodeoxyribonuclease VII large subunit [Virgibacillus halophilus]